MPRPTIDVDLFLFCSYDRNMQYALPFVTHNRVVSVHQRLFAAFGPPPECFRLDPVSQLVLSMLNARTRSGIAKRVFKGLANRFFRWEDLALTPADEVEILIRGVTHAERKAKALPTALQAIMRRRHALDLDFLAAWPAEAALAWLEELPGVGPKTGAAVLNFSTLHMRALVVDTAHWRAARRLGLVPPRADLARAARLLSQQIPDDWTADDAEEHHVLMQRLGKTYCTHAKPSCGSCPLRSICVYACFPSLHGRKEDAPMVFFLLRGDPNPSAARRRPTAAA